MKKILLLTAAVCTLFLAGCRSVVDDPIRLDFSSAHKSNDKYKMSNISDGSFYTEIYRIFYEETEAYIAGRRTKEELADVIQSRVGIWLSEHE